MEYKYDKISLETIEKVFKEINERELKRDRRFIIYTWNTELVKLFNKYKYKLK